VIARDALLALKVRMTESIVGQRFADPMWRGIALYRAGHYDEAVEAFARVDTAGSYDNQGNALARLGRLPAAVASYREALKRRPDWPEAKVPNEKPDQIQFDDKGRKGKVGEIEIARQTAELWMRNIQTTPRDLLQRKFAIETHQASPK
jgi:Ca-activated chloride channel family protein